MKYQKLKKQVFTESGIVAAIIGVLGGSVFLLNTLSNDYHNHNDALQNEVTGISNTTTTLQEKYFKVQQNANIYQKALQAQSRGALSITRQTLRDKFNEFNDQYHLSNLRLSLSGIDEISDPQYKRGTYAIIGSDVTLTFDAISDEYIFALINGMESDLAGSCRIMHLMLVRQKPVTDDVLREISHKGTFPLISGEIKFKWFGIKPVETSERHADAPLAK